MSTVRCVETCPSTSSLLLVAALSSSIVHRPSCVCVRVSLQILHFVPVRSDPRTMEKKEARGKNQTLRVLVNKGDGGMICKLTQVRNAERPSRRKRSKQKEKRPKVVDVRSFVQSVRRGVPSILSSRVVSTLWCEIVFVAAVFRQLLPQSASTCERRRQRPNRDR